MMVVDDFELVQRNVDEMHLSKFHHSINQTLTRRNFPVLVLKVFQCLLTELLEARVLN